MRARLQSLLRLAGLREEEAALYIHLLKLRRASMSELISLSGLNVMTAYRTMKRLQERGLVSAFKINLKESIYAPLTLSALSKKLDAEQRKLRKLQLALQDLDPLLPYIDMEATKDDAEPIEVREGLEAFREEYLKIPEMSEHFFLHIGDMGAYWRVAEMSEDHPLERGFRQRRMARGVGARVLNIPSPEALHFSKLDSREMRITKLTEHLPVTNNYLTFTEHCVCHFLCEKENPRVIVIRNPELVALHHQQFKNLWDASAGT